VDEPITTVVVHLDDEVAVAHPRPVVGDLDKGVGGSALVQCAAGRLCDRPCERRTDSSAALPPGVDLENLAALEHREARLAPDERGHCPTSSEALRRTEAMDIGLSLEATVVRLNSAIEALREALHESTKDDLQESTQRRGARSGTRAR